MVAILKQYSKKYAQEEVVAILKYNCKKEVAAILK